MVFTFPLFLTFPAGSEELGDLDSLDGQLPSSSRSLIQADPSGGNNEPPSGPPPPAPPLMQQNNHNNNNNNSSNQSPLAYTKGPGAKNKKHRKINKDTVRTKNCCYSIVRTLINDTKCLCAREIFKGKTGWNMCFPNLLEPLVPVSDFFPVQNYYFPKVGTCNIVQTTRYVRVCRYLLRCVAHI